MNFFLEKKQIKFSCTYWPLSFCKIKKKFLGSIQSSKMCYFGAQNSPLVMNKNFLGKLLISFSFTYQPLSLCKIFRKFFQQIQSYEDVQVLSPKWPISANENFFQKTCWWALFLSFMLSTFQKSTSDINLLVKSIKEYWNLIVQEPFLAITWQPDFSQTCSFGRMLINHKNFYFTQILDKTNDTIFLKSPKTMFFGHFWPFLPYRDIFPKIQLPHTTLYGP